MFVEHYFFATTEYKTVVKIVEKLLQKQEKKISTQKKKVRRKREKMNEVEEMTKEISFSAKAVSFNWFNLYSSVYMCNYLPVKSVAKKKKRTEMIQ